MLHEILLSLSGYPSPLLKTTGANSATGEKGQLPDGSVLTQPERELLGIAGHLSDLHCKLIKYTARISDSHPSVICRVASTAISSTHLAAFQRKVLEVEEGILRGDAELVGAYKIVPLTAVVGKFTGWTRTLEWLWDMVQFIMMTGKFGVGDENDGSMKAAATTCTAATLINKLRAELNTGYKDIEDAALVLLRAAETAWLRQVSAWVLYGRIPTLGAHDFFIQRDEADEQGHSINFALLPSFVTPATANSILFVGSSLNRVRSRGVLDASTSSVEYISTQLRELSALEFPLRSVALSKAITSIRLTLSRAALQKLLPLSRVVELLELLREFFLLRRGEFAMALIQQADDKIRGRWRRADNLAYYDKRHDVGLGTVQVKEGEATAVLNRTWAALGSAQTNQHSAEEDEMLELARDLLRLELTKSSPSSSSRTTSQASAGVKTSAAATATAAATNNSHHQNHNHNYNDHLLSRLSTNTAPFQSLLLSVPVILTMSIPQPLDLFLSPSDLQVYISINSYLLALRRAHIRLTDLWKTTPLRRHHPCPPKPPYSTTKHGIQQTSRLRQRANQRNSLMRRPWSTSSAAIFFLAETEAYLQSEVVERLWVDFHTWLTSSSSSSSSSSSPSASSNNPNPNPKDPQTLSQAHSTYLSTLSTRLLLTCSSSSSSSSPSPPPSSPSPPTSTSTSTSPTTSTLISSFQSTLQSFLHSTDSLTASITRLSTTWKSLDLEEDEGVVDAFSDPRKEEREVTSQLLRSERRVRKGIRDCVEGLRKISLDEGFLGEVDGGGAGAGAGGGGGDSMEDGLGGGGGFRIRGIWGGGAASAGDGGGGGGDGEGRGADDKATSNGGYDNDDGSSGTYRPVRGGGIDRLLMKLDFGGWFDDDDTAATVADEDEEEE